MSAVLTVIAFIKSVSGSNTLSGVATTRLDVDEYLEFQYKAFNASESNLIEEIRENSVCVHNRVIHENHEIHEYS